MGIILKSLLLAVAILNGGNGANIENYPKTMIVTNLDYSTDTVTLEDSNGNSWEMIGCEDYFVGDYVSLVMCDMGTDNIYDDEIVSARYSGYYKN